MSNDIASNVVEARKVHFLVCISFQRLCCLWCNQTTFFNVMSSLRIVTAAFTIWFMKHFSKKRTYTRTMLSCTLYVCKLQIYTNAVYHIALVTPTLFTRAW